MGNHIGIEIYVIYLLMNRNLAYAEVFQISGKRMGYSTYCTGNIDNSLEEKTLAWLRFTIDKFLTD